MPLLRPRLKRAQKNGLETLLDYGRLAYLAAAVKATNHLPGDCIEFGSFRGGSAAVIRQYLNSEKVLYVLDSFEGLPEPSEYDNYHSKGDFSETSYRIVAEGLNSIGVNIKVMKGYFSDSLETLSRYEHLQFSFAHIDADLYKSVLEALEFVYPRMAKGRFIILDDYLSPTCIGAKLAVDQFLGDKPEQIEVLCSPAGVIRVGGGSAAAELNKNLGLLLRSGILRKVALQQ